MLVDTYVYLCIVFPSVIALERFYIRVELGFDVVEELLKFCKNFGFLFKRENPQVVCKMIQENNIITESTNARNGRSPNIGMYYFKCMRNNRIGNKERKLGMLSNLTRVANNTKFIAST